MITDTILVALIKESVTSDSAPRRIAARLILDDVRGTSDFCFTQGKAEVVRADAGPEVVKEMYSLVKRLGLLAPES